MVSRATIEAISKGGLLSYLTDATRDPSAGCAAAPITSLWLDGPCEIRPALYLDQGVREGDEHETGQHPEPERWEVPQFELKLVHIRTEATVSLKFGS